MQSLRRALCNHLELVRTFILEIVSVDSGLYDVDRLNKIIREADTIVRIETEWISALLEALGLIKLYVTLVNSWADHVYGLAQNLGATKTEIRKFERLQVKATDILRTKTCDSSYMKWVLADASQEVDRLVATTRELLSNVSRIVELAKRFGGPFLEQVQRIALAWTKTERLTFYEPLIAILQTAHTKPDTKAQLQILGRYLDTIAMVVSSTPMFARESEPTSYSPKILRSSHGLVKQLIEGTENMHKFVQQRTQAYMLIVRHHGAILHAVLPPSISVEKWIVDQYIDRSKPIDTLLPSDIITNTLPFALQQAEEALIEWDSAIAACLPYLKEALILNELLQSPSIGKFLAADQLRLEIYRRYRPRIEKSFSSLCKIAK
ncbi:MAG: hypothetical protein ACFFDP_08575 [Promethearchaeota archaeon]